MQHRKTQSAKFLLVLALMALNFIASIQSATAEALLQILPTRVMLEDKQRAATLTLVNQGDEDAAYRMFFRNIRMSETGKFNIITDQDDVSNERFADAMLRYSPRRIKIPATGKQTIRIVARKPADLEAGEYRSHMVFRRLPNQKSILEDSSAENLTLSIQPIVEVTIPVIVRHGELNAKVLLDDAKIIQKDLKNILQVAINRTGNRSLYGDLKVTGESLEGKKVTLAEARGISVYYPNSTRIFELPLTDNEQLSAEGNENKNIDLNGFSQLFISFKENPTYGGDESHSIELKI